ncbi:MAG: N-acetylmuramoyl-L-alanine amidase [Candidatus Caldarchaeum sp.]
MSKTSGKSEEQRWQFKTYNSIASLLLEQQPIGRKINKIVLHYSAVPHPPLGKVLEHVAAIDKFHREKNGWVGIGYHIAIHPSGVIVSCRPLRVVGSHSRGHNTGSVGVVMLCDSDYLKSDPPLLVSTVIHVLNGLCSELGIDKGAVFLHRQLNQTICPPITERFLGQLHKAGFTNVRLENTGNK